MQAVIFDMFETLASLFEGRSYFSEDMARDVSIPEKEFKEVWHKTEEGRSTGKYTVEEAVSIVLNELGVFSEEGRDTIIRGRRRNLEDTFSADLSESVSMLKRLKDEGYKIGLISNCYSDERDMIRKSAMFPFFDAAVLSYEAGVCKPDERIFKICLQQLNISADKCFYVGDGGSNELFAARDIGMRPLQCLYYHHLAFEPHIPCGILPGFDHIYKRSELFEYLHS